MVKKKAKDSVAPLTAAERLGLRISGMVNSPKAQLERRVMIHRLDTDTEEAWDSIMEVLTETDGLTLVFDDDGSVVVTWASECGYEVGQSDGETPF